MTVMDSIDGLSLIYECEAEGFPLPNISWSATNFSTNEIEILENDFPGITIIGEVEPDEVKSLLTISSESQYFFPRCMAASNLGEVSYQFDSEFETTVLIGE